MKKCMCVKRESGMKSRRKTVKNIKLLLVTERKGDKYLPVYRYDEYNEILEEMAKKALEILEK